MTIFFVSRHKGALSWISKQGVSVDKVLSHLEIDKLHSGDAVIGTLPVHIAAKLTQLKVSYYHLVLNIPEDKRGMELTDELMDELGAALIQYEVFEVQS